MQHSVSFIGKQYERVSSLRGDKRPFSSEGFFKFAKAHAKEYSLIENGDDLLVSSWHSDRLIADYQNTLDLKC